MKCAPGVLKKLQNLTYARRTSETRSKRVTSTLAGTLGVLPVRVARFVCVWDKQIQTCLKFSGSSACPGRVTYTFRISSTRVTGALNTPRTRLGHVLCTSVYATCAFRFYEYCFSGVPQACVRRALNVCCAPLSHALMCDCYSELKVQINFYTSKIFSVLRFFIRSACVWVIR